MKVICKEFIKTVYGEDAFWTGGKYFAEQDGDRYFVTSRNGSEVLFHEDDFKKHFRRAGKQYAVKVTTTATAAHPSRAGEVLEFYIGRESRVTESLYYLEGWRSRYWAERYIEQDKAWHEEHEAVPPAWSREYMIIEYDE